MGFCSEVNSHYLLPAVSGRFTVIYLLIYFIVGTVCGIALGVVICVIGNFFAADCRIFLVASFVGVSLAFFGILRIFIIMLSKTRIAFEVSISGAS